MLTDKQKDYYLSIEHDDFYNKYVTGPVLIDWLHYVTRKYIELEQENKLLNNRIRKLEAIRGAAWCVAHPSKASKGPFDFPESAKYWDSMCKAITEYDEWREDQENE